MRRLVCLLLLLSCFRVFALATPHDAHLVRVKTKHHHHATHHHAHKATKHPIVKHHHAV